MPEYVNVNFRMPATMKREIAAMAATDPGNVLRLVTVSDIIRQALAQHVAAHRAAQERDHVEHPHRATIPRVRDRGAR